MPADSPAFVKSNSVGWIPYNQVVELLASKNASYDDVLAYLNARGIKTSEVPNIQSDIAAWRSKSYTSGSTFFQYAPTQQGNKSVVLGDSNTATPTRGNITRPVNVVKDPTTGKAKFGKILSKLNSSKGMVVAGEVSTAVAATAAAVQFGKYIDRNLYEANPDFWDSIGLSTLNPDTWNNITSGLNAPGMQATVDAFNFLFDLDPDTGQAQAYMDATALQYMAVGMAKAGVFDTGSYTPGHGTIDGVTILPFKAFKTSCTGANTGTYASTYPYSTGMLYAIPNWSTAAPLVYAELVSKVPIENVAGTLLHFGSTYEILWAFDEEIPRDSIRSQLTSPDGKYRNWSGPTAAYQDSATYEGKTAYRQLTQYSSNKLPTIDIVELESQPSNAEFNYTSWAMIYDAQGGTVVPGISDQAGATVPDAAQLGDLDKAATYLPTLYPGLYSNPMYWDTVNPETGEEERRMYLPVPFPDLSTALDPQPIIGTATQQQPAIKPTEDTQPTADELAKIIQQYLTDTTTPPPNPQRTGEGSAPPLVIPAGTAGALWSVYHPTQAQVNQFGGWLWSSDFVDQLLKVFNNPMESLIGLHKIYAQPVDAGQSTIAVGYLDSGVPSATVEQQYVYVDCGHVTCYEDFGNVFDYSPYTSVKLYLPFVGIVQLDVADVMRSTIGVRYGVDVFTGACLAMVSVNRDGSGDSVLYQYAGNCAVQYPISSGSYMGIVSGILSVAGGVAATLATGGGAAPLALGVAGGAMSAHTQVQNSGGFAGNSGAMGGKKPYLIISRPQSMMEYNYPGMRGAPSNYTVQVKNCEGLIKCKAVRRLEAHATDAELDEIREYLMEGVIV